MKKKTSVILSLLLAVLMISAAFSALLPATAASVCETVTVIRNDTDYSYLADPQGRGDVLDGLDGEYLAPKYPTGLSGNANVVKLTDGVYAVDPALSALAGDNASRSYFNLAWCNNGEQKDLENAGGTCSYPLTSGQTQNYLYRIEWKNMNADVCSFSLWFNNETDYSSSYKTDTSYSWWQQDAQFDILVSQDGGKTYSVAFSSEPLAVEENGSNTILKSCAAKLISEGGNWEMFDAVDENGKQIFRYRVCAGDFVQEFKGVTNIVYAASHSRRNGNSAEPFYYAARLSEIDVYTKPADEAVTTVPVTQAPTEKEPATREPVPVNDNPSAGVTVELEKEFSAGAGKNSYGLTVKVTNTSDYPVGDIVIRPKDISGLKLDESADLVIPQLAAGESVTRVLNYQKEKAGCRSLAPVGAVILLALFLACLLGKGKKKGTALLAIVLCVSLLQPMSVISGAEPETAADGKAPAVTVTKAEPSGDTDRYQYLTFTAEYSCGEKQSAGVSQDCSLNGKTYAVTVDVSYSDYIVTDIGFYALPTYGLDTLAMAVKDNSLDLTDGSVLGADIPVIRTDSSAVLASQGTFRAAWPEKIYTKSYNVKFTAVASITLQYHGKSYTVFSDPYASSVLLAAQALQNSDALSAEEKADLEKNVIDRAGKTSVLSEEEETELRRGIVNKMEDMASVRWSPAKSVSTNGQLNYSTPNYIEGKTYAGLIYNQFHYGTAEAFSYLLDENGQLDPFYTKDVSSLWNNTPGVSCSTSVTGAYAYFCTGIKQVVGATNMIPSKPDYGFSRNTTYLVPDKATLTEEVLNANSAADIYAAYAALKPADVLVAIWKNSAGSTLGHSIMARELPEVVYKADGSVDEYKSKIKTIEQHATIIMENNTLTTWKHGEYTFHELYAGKQMKFIPVKYAGLISEATVPSYCIISGMNTETLLTEGLSGRLETNYDVRYFGVTVTDASGKQVYDIKTTPGTGYAKTMLLGSCTDISEALKALPFGTYQVRIAAVAKNTEHVLLNQSLTK